MISCSGWAATRISKPSFSFYRRPSCQRAIACKAPRHSWHLRQSRQSGLCNLQNLREWIRFESHPLRHPPSLTPGVIVLGVSYGGWRKSSLGGGTSSPPHPLHALACGGPFAPRRSRGLVRVAHSLDYFSGTSSPPHPPDTLTRGAPRSPLRSRGLAPEGSLADPGASPPLNLPYALTRGDRFAPLRSLGCASLRSCTNHPALNRSVALSARFAWRTQRDLSKCFSVEASRAREPGVRGRSPQTQRTSNRE